MNISNVQVYGLEESMTASGYPMSTDIDLTFDETELKRGGTLGHAKSGSGHDCFLKGIIVQADVTAPQYFWLQWDRYHFHDVVSSQSTMHRITKMDLDTQCNEYVEKEVIEVLKRLIFRYNNYTEYVSFMRESGYETETKEKLFQKIASNIPEGLMLTKRITSNYLQMKSIYGQRRGHKLEEWKIYCDWIESLPKFKELVL